MNVIVSNLNRDKFSNLDVDVIKELNGEFDSSEIVQTFANFFFNRMFLDITAIKDYKNLNNLKILSMGLNVDKVILLLNDDSVVNSNVYLSKLVSMGIYNFARNENELMYLYNNPNTYKDVAYLQEVENSIIDDVSSEIIESDVRVVGIKNVTDSAGATSLVYMFHKILSKYYSVISIEINKGDFLFYNDKTMVSVNEKEIGNAIMKYKDVNVILIDLNDLNDVTSNNICTDILYLVEPSLTKINKLIMLDHKAFDGISGEKIILNKSFFNEKDIRDFEFEANIKVFHNLPPLNDRKDNSNIIMPLFEKIGLFRKVDN